MNKKDAFDFLLRTAIPEAAVLPENLKNPLVWDAVFRAHRDVLTGRKYVAYYTKNKVNGQKGQVNAVAKCLYQAIEGRMERHESLRSCDLIAELGAQFPEVLLGARQKLVNMTLKYLFLLQLFEKIPQNTVQEADCDCPLDSRILSALNRADVKWTALEDQSLYDELQGIVRDKAEADPEIQSRLHFDYYVWARMDANEEP